MRLNIQSQQGAKPEPTIALINIVFLMLIFFLIAGTLATPIDRDLTLVKTSDLEGRDPPDALVILSDGTLRFRGEIISLDAYTTRQAAEQNGILEMRVVPDQNLPAKDLIRLTDEMRGTGAERVFIVTERALQ